MTQTFAVRRCGPQALLIDCGSEWVAAVATTLRVSGEFTEVIPAESSVMVIATASLDSNRVKALLTSVELEQSNVQGQEIEIPTKYDGVDLEEVASLCRLTVAKLIKIHSEVVYRATFAGFSPGFMYCTGLPKQLHLPRRSAPRVKVPQGSVAIADAYTAVYPRESPGGWHLLGTTDAVMFDPTRQPESLLQPGDLVRFVAMRST